FKAASLDLAAALTGKACGAEEFHAWTIRDFAAGVTLSEAVDESFRAGGWRLDLVSRDSELSRIYLASRGDDGLILNWLPDEGVVGLLMCAAAEPGSVPERVAAAAPPRGFSLDPTMPPLPLPRPSAEAVAAATADLAATDPAAPAATPAELALADPLRTATPAPPLADAPPAPAAADIAVTPAPVESAPTARAIAPAPAGAGDPAASPAAPLAAQPAPETALAMTAGAPEAPLVAGATEPPLATAAPVPASLATAPAPAAIPPTRTPIDLGMTAAILDEAGAAAPPAGETALAAAEPPRRPFSDAAAAYERVPPPSGLVDPTSVAVSTAAPAARPQPGAAPVVPTRPVTLLAQGPAIAVGPVDLQAQPIPVTTILAPVFEPGGMPVWPYFLLAVVLAGAGLAIILRRATPPVPPAHAEWPTALASVVGANLDERVGEAGIEFTPVLRYRFSVGENEFEAVTEGWGGRALPTRSAAEAVIASFPDHARVEISYDPTDPTRIALPEAARPADPMLMVAAACLLLAALTLALTLV
ncbi:MAG: DUF3592 domain-containing protein, partial [Bauldia sp.]|nr:DUF3592 domain-containing protein [Bauldia sp.]